MENTKLATLMAMYRARHGLSMKDLAAECGLSYATVSAVERGEQTPTRRTEAAIRIVIEKEDA